MQAQTALHVLQQFDCKGEVGFMSINYSSPQRSVGSSPPRSAASRGRSAPKGNSRPHQVASSIQEQRRQKVHELVRRQKQHVSDHQMQQVQESKVLGAIMAGSAEEEEQRRQKIKELKHWLKTKEQDISRTGDARDQGDRGAGKGHSLHKLEQAHMEMRDRRARIGEKKRDMMPKSFSQPQGVTLRHVHHHVHYHDRTCGSEERLPGFAEVGGMVMMPSGSVGMLGSTSQASMQKPLLVQSAASMGNNWNQFAT